MLQVLKQKPIFLLMSSLPSLRSMKSPPPLLGFGISKPEQVAAAIKAGAAGAISGSATVNIIEQNLQQTDKMLSELGAFVTEMKAATQK